MTAPLLIFTVRVVAQSIIDADPTHQFYELSVFAVRAADEEQALALARAAVCQSFINGYGQPLRWEPIQADIEPINPLAELLDPATMPEDAVEVWSRFFEDHAAYTRCFETPFS